MRRWSSPKKWGETLKSKEISEMNTMNCSNKTPLLNAKESGVFSDEFRNPDFLFKVLIVGDSGVGKSCLLLRYCDRIFCDSFMTTIGVDFKFKTLLHSDKRVKLQLWDTAGQERFRGIATNYFRNAQGVVLCADVTNPESFAHLVQWKELVIQHSRNPAIVGCVIGTKNDLVDQRKVTFEQARQVANSLGFAYVETSAKRDVGVEQAFGNLVPSMMFTVVQNQATKQQQDADKNKKLDGTKVSSLKSKLWNCSIV